MICLNINTMQVKVKLKILCRLIFYSGGRRTMGRKAEPIIIESVEFDYVGTDSQFNTFLKSVIKDYLTENHLLSDDYDDKINFKKSV